MPVESSSHVVTLLADLDLKLFRVKVRSGSWTAKNNNKLFQTNCNYQYRCKYLYLFEENSYLGIAMQTKNMFGSWICNSWNMGQIYTLNNAQF